MSFKSSKMQTILICNDLDGTLFNTEKFIEFLIKSLSSKKSEVLRKKIQESRNKKGTSSNLSIMDIIGDEVNNIEKTINRSDYIYDEAEKYIKTNQVNSCLVKHIILTRGNESLQKLKIKNTFLEKLPIEVRSSNDKIEFINSLLNKNKKYCYKSGNTSEEFVADGCVLVDDKITCFKDCNDSFNKAKTIKNFLGIKINRNSRIDKETPKFIKNIQTLDQVFDHIKHISID